MELFEHQKKAIALSERFPSRMIVRSPGTGKTLIGINIALNQLQHDNHSKILWVGPANLEPQYKNAFGAFSLPYHSIFDERDIRRGVCNICSFDMLRLNKKLLCSVKWDLVIIDEIHKAKNLLTQTNKALWALRRKSKRWYAFTGTPFQNNPYEFFELVSLSLGRRVTLDCEECLAFRSPRNTPIRNFLRRIGFKLSRVNQGPIIGVKKPDKLRAIFGDIVDYMPHDMYHRECRLPEVHVHPVEVEMTQDEIAKYQECAKKLTHKKKFRNFISDNLDDEKIDGYFNNIAELRTISISDSKIHKAIEIITAILKKASDARILIFSNFVEKVLLKLSQELDRQDIGHLFYHGGVSTKHRDFFVSSYLSGTKQIMLLSPVGFEGLDLYGTTHVIILDPHYNPERTTQLISRAVRAYSSVSEIDVVQLLSVSKHLKMTIDQSIVAIANRKTRLAQFLENILS